MKTYTVNVKLVFEGTANVNAESVFEAKKKVKEHMFAYSPTINADLDILDWNIGTAADIETTFNQNGKGLEEIDQ